MNPSDEDNDSMGDSWYGEVDKCQNTLLPESVPNASLNPEHFAGLWDTFYLQTNIGSKVNPDIVDSQHSLIDTYGCSCEQILFCKPGDNGGEYKFGCSSGTMNIWTTQTAWSFDCQIDGIVSSSGEDKDVLEDTDNDTILDIYDDDIDNDGVPDSLDSEIESANGDGNPDWWCEQHPNKC